MIAGKRISSTDTVLLVVKIALWIALLAPLIFLLGAAYRDALGANPVEKILHETGYWALTILLITLAVTPIRKIAGIHWLARIRRLVGLFAFFYAFLHLASYLVLDQFFDWQNIFKDILKRPYITVGFSAFLLMVPMAVTSTQLMIRRLGGSRWQKIHQMIYLVGLLGVIHFCWLVKKDLRQPVIFALIFSVLMGCRWFFWVRKVRKA